MNSLADTARQVNTELLERLRFFTLDPHCVLDLGAGTCLATRALREKYPRAQVIALDRSQSMLEAAPRSLWPRSRFHRIVGGGIALPLRDRSVDLIYSCLMLPFCEQPAAVFRELARVLKPGGVFVFSTIGADTLPDVPQLGDALMQSGLAEPVMDVEQYEGLGDHAGAPATQIIYGAAFGAGTAPERHTGAAVAGEFAVPLDQIGRPKRGI